MRPLNALLFFGKNESFISFFSEKIYLNFKIFYVYNFN
jgi:hypothetical protein